jgi:hypothetical protein
VIAFQKTEVNTSVTLDYGGTLMKTNVVLLLVLMLTAFFRISSAKTPSVARGGESAPVTTRYKPFNKIHKNFQVHLSFDLSGPLLFNDTPDSTIDELTAFNYGGSLTFMLGNEIRDFHRLGLGVSYHMMARSQDRKLDSITPYLAYEIGHPLVLQLRGGYAITTGTSEFAENYAGVYGGILLKYSFTNSDSTSPVSVSAGLAADAVISMEASEYSSVFVGVKLEIIYHK